MSTVHMFHVVPALPESLDALRSIAVNLRWAWNHDSVDLFRRLDRDLWERSGHNPTVMLGTVSQERLREAAQDESFLSHMDRVQRSNEAYMASKNTWFERQERPDADQISIAYFSMEFGITECVPIYSGGLGVLSGDHLKSASDLGLPLVAVGLLYQQGYFRQSLNADGWQQERYPTNDFYNLPIEQAKDSAGESVKVALEMFPGRTVWAQVWKAQVGRVPLYLMDTNISENRHDDQHITDQLYGGDVEMRLKQEIVLGIGGMRALDALGYEPSMCHMNEGHSAFSGLERARMLMRKHEIDFRLAREVGASSSLFTTHTPVPAGFDVFSAELLSRYFGAYVSELGLSFTEFMALGRTRGEDADERFNMAILALKNSHACNGVSKLHGQVTRRMVQTGYPGFPEDEVPVAHVTNGVHTRSFISSEMADLLDRYLGGRWSQDVSDPAVWARVDDIPDEDLWRVREFRRERLVNFARARLRTQLSSRGASEHELRLARAKLNPSALTIGFARRFATYKRASLFLADAERIISILNDKQRPVQIVLAGKSHPKDDGGKELIRHIVQFAQREDIADRVVFLEDYDLTVARYLVQGVDLWLNTPRRPMEASGTSGMKTLANGGLNCSIPDGWWAEAYDPRVGWSIGKGEDYSDPEYQDRAESRALYDLLEKEIVPLFYDRSADGIPRGWVNRVKHSMRTLCPVFNTHRMVSEYAERFYFPGSLRRAALMERDIERGRELVEWKQRMRNEWPNVRIEQVEAVLPVENEPVHVGSEVGLRAAVNLGGLSTDDVRVEAVHGLLDAHHQVTGALRAPLQCTESEGSLHRYEGSVPCTTSGMQGFTVRVLPMHSDAALPQELSLITWEP